MSLFNDIFRKHGSSKNPALERAMHEVALNDNAKTRESLYKAILASRFIIQGDVSGGHEMRKGRWIAGSNTQVAFKTVEHPPGTIVLPIFTDVQALISWVGSEVQLIALRAPELFSVNCAGQHHRSARKSIPAGANDQQARRNNYSKRVHGFGTGPPARIDGLKYGPIESCCGTKAAIGMVAQEPSAVLEALTGYLQQLSELRGAYLFQMTNQNVTSSAIGLQFDTEPSA